jgi:lipoprotein-releasing system ATP-binding protein
MAELVVRNVAKQYATREAPLDVLRDVSLTLKSGQNLAILGPSGCGKSTLLHILGTLENPTSGRVLLDGRDPFQLDEPALAAFRNRHVGFVFQDHHLLPQCSVFENVLLPTLAEGTPTTDQVVRARLLLERVGLERRLSHLPAELSGGERQRAAVARALINQPTLLLADEPTGNLDRATAATIGQLLLEVHAQEQTMLIVVTHSLELAALLDRRLLLEQGGLKPEHGPRDADRPAAAPK